MSVSNEVQWLFTEIDRYKDNVNPSFSGAGVLKMWNQMIFNVKVLNNGDIDFEEKGAQTDSKAQTFLMMLWNSAGDRLGYEGDIPNGSAELTSLYERNRDGILAKMKASYNPNPPAWNPPEDSDSESDDE
jgi:hypothetical protein